MAKLRPVSSEDRFTLVEHLTELRSRIIACIAIFVVAFAVAYWQNGTVLKIINAPLESAQKPSAKKCETTGDSLEQSTCFDRAVADALAKMGPVLQQDGGRESATESKRRAEALEAVRRVNDLRPTNTERKPVTLGVAEPFFQTLNIAMYGALVLSLPLLLYQLYAFLIPAFTSRERKAIVPLLVGVPFLFYAGVAFGYFLALPRAVDFLQNFNDDAFDILVQAKDYYKFVGLFLAGTGVVFQVPVVVIAISRLGILTPKQLRKQRGIVWIISAVVAAVITPTPDAVTMILMMAPLLVLFEISVGIAALLERRSPARGPLADWKDLRDRGYDEDEPDDPYAFDDPEDDGGGPDGGFDGPGRGFDGPEGPDVDPPAPRSPRGAGSRTMAPVHDDAAYDDDPTFEDEVVDDEEPFAGVFDDEDDDLAFEDPEAPDPGLQGDPEGPRPATADDPEPLRPEDRDPWAEGGDPPAEDRDPWAEGPTRPHPVDGRPATDPPAGEPWMADADDADADDPFARDDDPGADGPRRN